MYWDLIMRFETLILIFVRPQGYEISARHCREDFEKHGHWALYKTTKTFSAIPFDHVHEQVNKTVKGVGGAIEPTQNPSAFR